MSSLLPKNKKWRVGLLSLGCPKTLVDSEVILGKLDEKRYDLAPSVTDCDIALINTCAFIQDAQQESIDHILRLIELKKEGAIHKLIVMGCLTQRFAPELQEELKEVDAFVGSGEYAKIPQIMEQVTSGVGLVSEIGIPGYLYTSAERRVHLTPRYSRYLKLSEGCDHTCSFCVIPSFRGKHRSRLFEDVVEEATYLVEDGAREIILAGQDTTFFGYDLKGKYLLSELLRELNKIQSLRWIRILYAYPSLVTDSLIESMAKLDKVCHYLDMPLQHVNDRILKSMRRGTTHQATIRLVEKLRSRIPDLAIRTTFIVGYPGETEAEFDELLRFMEWAQFERLGVFTYSQEQGSDAAGLSGQIPDKVKQQRLERAMVLQQKISSENNRKLMGKILQVLVEEEAKAGVWMGRTYMDAPDVDGKILFSTVNRRQKIKAGDFVFVKVQDSQEYDLIAEWVEARKLEVILP